MERVREGEREGGRKEEGSHTTPIIQPLPPALYAASSFLLHNTTPIIQPLPPMLYAASSFLLHIHYTYHPAPSSYMYMYTPHCWYTPTHPAPPPTLHLSSTLLHYIPPAPSTLYLSFVPYIPPTHTLTFLS